MTEEELSVCEECWVNHKTISKAFIMRKLKCSYDHAEELVKEYERYVGIEENE
jgi:hypothetical protein